MKKLILALAFVLFLGFSVASIPEVGAQSYTKHANTLHVTSKKVHKKSHKVKKKSHKVHKKGHKVHKKHGKR